MGNICTKEIQYLSSPCLPSWYPQPDKKGCLPKEGNQFINDPYAFTKHLITVTFLIEYSAIFTSYLNTFNKLSFNVTNSCTYLTIMIFVNSFDVSSLEPMNQLHWRSLYHLEISNDDSLRVVSATSSVSNASSATTPTSRINNTSNSAHHHTFT